MLVGLCLVALFIDVVVIPRVAAERCAVYGGAATALGLEEGAMVDPDSGGCAAYGCADGLRSAPRILLPDYRAVTRWRTNC